jgi:hypothetical protein
MFDWLKGNALLYELKILKQIGFANVYYKQIH